MADQEHNQTPSKQAHPRARKRTYRKPEIVELGDVRNLTLGPSGSVRDGKNTRQARKG